ncbi:MAG: tRNA pseudouridine(38-40) synthase TruA [Lachnospiraceae bacterium]|nr:tRNA pseudouridine(38-40) synthase TruA [Lachnospiraceae bacterium]
MRVKLVVAYDGTAYCGWQIQPNGITVQQVLNETLSQFFHQEIAVVGASRTDSGVHALCNVCAFDVDTRMPADKISYALNQFLPDDISVVASEEVDKDFHPRFQKGKKTYEYKILNSRFPNPVERLYSLFYHRSLDVERMKKAASYLVGEHDFTSFSSIHAQTNTFVRRVYCCDVEKDEGDMITIHIEGNGFLYNMVRIIAGTLIEVGNGRIEPEAVKDILEAKDRSKAGPTAPPEGLMLMDIQYDTSNNKNVIDSKETT